MVISFILIFGFLFLDTYRNTILDIQLHKQKGPTFHKGLTLIWASAWQSGVDSKAQSGDFLKDYPFCCNTLKQQNVMIFLKLNFCIWRRGWTVAKRESDFQFINYGGMWGYREMIDGPIV